MVTLENDPFGPGAGPVDMPFILDKTNARLIKDHYSNLGIEDLEIKLAISDMYGVEHEIKPELTFDPNGGTWTDGGREVREFAADLESQFKIIDAPKQDGYSFVCWKGSEYQPGQKYLADSDHTFVAQWEKNSTETSATSTETPTTSTKSPATSTSIDNAPVVLDDAPLVYTGRPITPVIQTIGGKTLLAGRDYTIRYTKGNAVIKAPTDAGTYTMTITGKGNFAG